MADVKKKNGMRERRQEEFILNVLEVILWHAWLLLCLASKWVAILVLWCTLCPTEANFTVLFLLHAAQNQAELLRQLLNSVP
jgi:hypothetical protein